MTSWYKQLLYSLLLASLMGSCQSVIAPAPADTTDYFPLETGRFTIFDVVEQRYSLTASPVLLTYQLKEVIGPLYTDVTGKPAYRLLRYRRSDDTQPWQLDSVWSARQTHAETVRTESGRDIVKLVFPVTDNTRWNANRLNTDGADDYELRNVGQPFSVSGMTFAETATVIEQADSTLVGQDKRRDVYARTIGLIYREVIQVQFCTASPGCIGKNQVNYGLQQTFRMRNYGKE